MFATLYDRSNAIRVGRPPYPPQQSSYSDLQQAEPKRASVHCPASHAHAAGTLSHTTTQVLRCHQECTLKSLFSTLEVQEIISWLKSLPTSPIIQGPIFGKDSHSNEVWQSEARLRYKQHHGAVRSHPMRPADSQMAATASHANNFM